MASKWPIVVEGNTPGKPENKRVATKGTLRKSLFSEKPKSSGHREWSEEETSALVQYICLYWEMPTRTDGLCKVTQNSGMLWQVQ
jgi:hypothetical protein